MSSKDADRERWLEEILHAYLQAVDAGQKPDPQELLRQHPDLADELTAFFADEDKLKRFAQELATRSMAPGSAALTQDSREGGGPTGEPQRVRYFGDYELLEEIARGGMGVVFRARQLSLNRLVALKRILKGELATAADVQRFRSEAQAAANLDHPHIVPIYEVGEHDGQQYFSMKLIQPAKQPPPADPREAARLVATIARAVHHAHQRGILHRDLKPSNILFDERGEPHVADFGLAKRTSADPEHEPGDLTRSGAIVGTPSYMAPEQARAEKMLTTAVDVYSLGAILYEWLTGRPPFLGTDVVSILMKVMNDEPAPPRSLRRNLDPDLETICLKCLEKDPARRYGSAEALADDLDRFLRGEPISAQPSSAWQRTRKWIRRRPAAAALIGMGIAMALVLLVGGLVFNGFLQIERGRVADTQNDLEQERRHVHDKQTQLEQVRREANTANALAQSAKNQAEDRLAQVYHEDAKRHLERGDWGGALRFLAEAVKVDQSDPIRAEGHRLGFQSLLKQGPRLLQVIEPDGMLEQVALSPDSRRLLTLTRDGNFRTVLQVWDAATGKSLTLAKTDKEIQFAEFCAHSQRVLAVVKSPDEFIRPVYGMEVWDAATGKRISAIIPAADLQGCRLARPFAHREGWSHYDGRHVITLNGKQADLLFAGLLGDSFFIDAEVSMRDADTGKDVFPVLKLAGRREIKLSPDARRLLAKTQKGDGKDQETEIRLWDLSSGKELRPTLGIKGPKIEVSFGVSGNQLLTVAGDTVRLWDSATGKALGPALIHETHVDHAMLSGDGKRLLTFSRGGEFKFVHSPLAGGMLDEHWWDVETGKEIAPPHAHLYSSGTPQVVFSPDGRSAFVQAGPFARVVDMNTASTLWESKKVGELGSLGRTQFSADGTYLIHLDLRGVRAWHLPSKKAVTPGLVLMLEDMMIDPEKTRCACSADGRFVLAPLRQDLLGLWAMPLGLLPQHVLDEAPLKTAAFDAGGRLFTVNIKDQARLWDPATRTAEAMPAPPKDAVFHRQAGLFVRVNSERKAVHVYRAETGKEVCPALQYPAGMIEDAVVSPNGARLAVRLLKDGWRLHFWDLNTGQPIGAPQKLPAPGSPVIFSPDGRRVLHFFTGEFQALELELKTYGQFWDTDAGRPIAEPFLYSASRETPAVYAFSPDSRWFLMGAYDGVRIFDTVAAKERPAQTLNLKANLKHLAVDPKGELILTASYTTVRLHDLATGKLRAPPMVHASEVSRVAFAPDGRHVLTMDNARAYVWHTATGRLLATSPALPHIALGEWSPNGKYAFLNTTIFPNTQQTTCPLLWDISVDSRPVEDIIQMAELLTGRQLDEHGNLIPLMPKDISLRWNNLSNKYAGEFSLVGPIMLNLWHRQQAAESERAGACFAARWHLDRLLLADPSQGSLFKRRAFINACLQAWPPARDDCDKALALKAESNLVWQIRGQAYAHLGDDDKAIADLTRAIECTVIEPPKAYPQNELPAEMLRALIHARHGRYDLAAKDCRSGQKKYRKVPSAQTWRAESLIFLAAGDTKSYQDRCASLFDWEEGASVRYSSTEISRICTLGPQALPAFDKLEEVLRKEMQRKKPAAEHGHLLAAVLFRAGKFNEAVSLWTETLKRHPQSGTPRDWLLRALAHHHLKQPKEAEVWRQRALHDMKAPAPAWDQQLEWQILRSEADKVLGPLL